MTESVILAPGRYIYIYIDDINRIQKILDDRRGGKFEGAEFFIRGMEIEKRPIRKK